MNIPTPPLSFIITSISAIIISFIIYLIPISEELQNILILGLLGLFVMSLIAFGIAEGVKARKQIKDEIDLIKSGYYEK